MSALRQMRFRGRFGALLALVFVGALAGAASAFSHSEASRGVFHVTLKAQLTKTWNYVATQEEGDCVTQTRVRGSRTVTLRSARPTVVTVAFANGRARYSSGIVRFLGGRVTQSEAVTAVESGGAGCRRSSKRSNCLRPRRALANQAVRFFRSAKDEISFARSRDFTAGLSPSCPPQAQPVRAERASLHLAEGEISERELLSTRYPSQTGFGSVEETTDFEGDENGKVVVRVSWQLTFARAG
jgi:hypothetical protein